MTKHITDAKFIQKKSRKHQVRRLYGNTYEVVSGTSGETYQVTAYDSGARCTCTWGGYRRRADMHRSGCSHVAAVYEHIAEEQARRVSVWTDQADADRQHRPARSIGDNVILTTRKAMA